MCRTVDGGREHRVRLDVRSDYRSDLVSCVERVLVALCSLLAGQCCVPRHIGTTRRHHVRSDQADCQAARNLYCLEHPVS